MEKEKMRRGLVMLTFMLLCSHRQATAEQQQQVEAATTTVSEPSENDSCMKFLLCVKNPSSSCITECCDSFNFNAPPLTKSICWSVAEQMDIKALTGLQKYCGFKAPPSPHNQEINQQEVIETSKPIDNKCSSNQQACAEDQEKLENCMSNTPSIDQNYPTFNIMHGPNGGYYNYAEDSINQQEMIETIKAIANNSSSNQQVATCCAKDKEKIKNCMSNTDSIDQCCPTFNIMLGRNCGCYNYAEDLDNQVLITLESYCDVTNPCKTAQVM
ncbi:putative protein isoform X1 [Capsicum galapagoense]